MQNPLDFLLEFLQKFDEGKVFLPSGSHAHKIHTKGRPANIWFGEAKTGNVPVCHGNVNMYGFSMDEDGFVLYAEVKTDSVEVEWQAILEPKV